MSNGSLGAYIASQRWSGARGEHVDAHVSAMVPVEAAHATCVVAEARVAGESVRFQLWPRDDAFDALTDERVRRGIAELLATDGSVRGTQATLVTDAEPLADLLRDNAATSALLGAEQSNTSIVYGGRAIVKLFRRLTPGVHPDVEITRFLTRRRFPHTPPLLATLTLHDEHGASLAAMAQTFVAGAQDEWAHVVDLARAAVRDGRADAAEARQLGVVTRALHDTLASDEHDADFAPRGADATTTARWAAAAARSVKDGVALLRERLTMGALSGDVRAAGIAAVDAVALTEQLRRAASDIADDAGAAIRHHGDYHLGQIIRAPDGTLFVIDFEGEPARPLDERRARHSPLRDVAGMLRSFAYAAATAAFERPDDAAAAARADAWERASRDAFLDGYSGAAMPAYLPRTRANTDALLAIFELEKVFYELAYELRNRPTWVSIPLAGIARLTDSAGVA